MTERSKEDDIQILLDTIANSESRDPFFVIAVIFIRFRDRVAALEKKVDALERLERSAITKVIR